MFIVNGKEIAAKIIAELKTEKRPDKILAAVFVGERPDSKSFLRQKELLAEELGVPFELFQFGDDVLEENLIFEIGKIGKDGEIGGLIVQLPLPAHYNRDRILSAINPRQDVDALTRESKELVNPLPVEVVREVLGIMNYELGDKVVAVVGKGFLVGQPIIEWLNGKCKELMIFDSKSDLSKIKEADLIITGVGKAGLIKPEMLKSGAAVIDFGYGIKDGKIAGDLDASSLSSLSSLSFYTPTPGGTGPILVAEIFKNFYKLNPPI